MERDQETPKWIKLTFLKILVRVFCGSALFSSTVGVREQGYCPERAAEERNPSFLSDAPAALLAAPIGSGLCLCKGTAAAGMELPNLTLWVAFLLLYLLFLWSDITGPVFDPVVLCISCCPS